MDFPFDKKWLDEVDMKQLALFFLLLALLSSVVAPILLRETNAEPDHIQDDLLYHIEWARSRGDITEAERLQRIYRERNRRKNGESNKKAS